MTNRSGEGEPNEAAGQVRVLRFPPDRSLGELRRRKPAVTVDRYDWWGWEDWEPFCEAQGTATVPAAVELELAVNSQAADDLSPPARLHPDDLYGLDLRRIKLYRNTTLLRHVQLLTGLRRLCLSATDPTDVHAAELTALPQLQEFDLAYGGITNRGMQHVQKLGNLRTLILTSNRSIGGAGVAHLEALTALETLDLELTRVGDEGVAHLTGLSHLQRLALGHTRITDKGLALLSIGM